MKRLLLVVLAVLISVPVVYAASVGGGNIVYKVKHSGDVTFSHDSHVTDRNFKCDDCHPSIFAMKRDAEKKRKMSDMRSKKACGICHNGKNAFDVSSNCYICHKK
ncbi:MAG: cytochrome c3 family protein [Nitrospirae bacterium]|nr:cytochrome c3 family protein [Nitrospirota bacterium]